MHKIAVLSVVIVLSLAGVSVAEDLPVYEGGYTVKAGEKWVVNPVTGGMLGGGLLPVVGEKTLSGPPFRWAAEVLANLSKNFNVLGRLGANQDRWDLVTIGCSYDNQSHNDHNGYCGISFNSVNPDVGGCAYSFPVKGDPTRIGPRSLLGLGRRIKIGSAWSQTYYFDTKAMKTAFISSIILARR